MSTKSFPEGFLWGTATAALQVEMGRGDPSTQSDWYEWIRDPDNLASGRVSGDLPEDGPGFWEFYPVDFRLAKEELGAHAGNSFAMRVFAVGWYRLAARATT